MKPRDVHTGLTADILRTVVSYDKGTGKFERGGEVCGCTCRRTGYVRIRIFGRKYLAHRLAWLYVHGEWPSDRIDHENSNRSDNRFSNLRAATSRQNAGNKKVRSDNALGCKGVRLHEGGRYQARIGIPGSRNSIHLGLFLTQEEARAAYLAAAKRQFKEFARAA